MKKIFLLAAAVLVSVQLCAKAPGGWENKIDKAKIKAQSAGKPIFIVISGAEWDKRSQAFEKQLFENKNFLKLFSTALDVFLSQLFLAPLDTLAGFLVVLDAT